MVLGNSVGGGLQQSFGYMGGVNYWTDDLIRSIRA